jgi:hypothetical protein
MGLKRYVRIESIKIGRLFQFKIEVLLWMTRTALELIGQSGLGYSFDGLTEESIPHPFGTAAKAFTFVFYA